MNTFMQGQIKNMLLIAKNFKQVCKIAALEDDREITKSERKELDRINKITDNYIKELEKLI